jgi:hypothetical protein
MGALFDPPKPPDTAQLVAAQQKQQEAVDKRQAELDAEEAARKRALAGRLRGRASLLGPAGEVGVTDDLKAKLGG